MNEISKVKNEVRLRQWAEMMQQWNKSGLTVSQRFAENGINLKTYYYRLNRVRKALCSEVEKYENVAVEFSVGEVRILLSNDFDPETLARLLEVLR